MFSGLQKTHLRAAKAAPAFLFPKPERHPTPASDCLSLLAGDAQAEAIDIFSFPEEVLGTAEAAGLPLPFAVVGSRQEEEVDGDIVPLRHYPWGTCLPSRKEHSDAVFFR